MVQGGKVHSHKIRTICNENGSTVWPVRLCSKSQTNLPPPSLSFSRDLRFSIEIYVWWFHVRYGILYNIFVGARYILAWDIILAWSVSFASPSSSHAFWRMPMMLKPFTTKTLTNALQTFQSVSFPSATLAYIVSGYFGCIWKSYVCVIWLAATLNCIPKNCCCAHERAPCFFSLFRTICYFEAELLIFCVQWLVFSLSLSFSLERDRKCGPTQHTWPLQFTHINCCMHSWRRYTRFDAMQ